MKNEIKNYLKEQKHRYVSGDSLKHQFNLNTIKLQKIIHELRVEGEPIISGGNLGYRYSTDKQEIMKTYLSLKNRAMSILSASNGLLTSMERIDNV